MFRYLTVEQVLEHLLKSGAGKVFYDAVDPARREELTREFLDGLREQRGAYDGFVVVHDYVAYIARKESR